jgi:hypothetical protein
MDHLVEWGLTGETRVRLDSTRGHQDEKPETNRVKCGAACRRSGAVYIGSERGLYFTVESSHCIVNFFGIPLRIRLSSPLPFRIYFWNHRSYDVHAVGRTPRIEIDLSQSSNIFFTWNPLGSVGTFVFIGVLTFYIVLECFVCTLF